MNLSELKKSVDDAIERATEMGEDPAGIPIFLQLDQQVDGSIWSAEQVELFYDGGAQCTGCVLSAYLPEDAPSKPVVPACPGCGGTLEKVTYPGGHLNREQWDSQKAGDYRCKTCPDNGRAANKQHAYFWEKELTAQKEENVKSGSCHESSASQHLLKSASSLLVGKRVESIRLENDGRLAYLMLDDGVEVLIEPLFVWVGGDPLPDPPWPSQYCGLTFHGLHSSPDAEDPGGGEEGP